jgi:two-component system, cell cycle sensor histidine kinase and response regulator CckA
MSGRQCMEEILKLDPNARIILSSGYSSGSMLNDLMSSARGFIAKPYDVKKLLQTVRNVLDED